jgi:HEAT repeat protein
MPAWFLALQSARQKNDEENQSWDVDWLKQVLRSEGLPEEKVPPIILRAFFALLERNYSNPVQAWRNHPDTQRTRRFVAFVQENIEQVPAVLAQISAAARVEALHWLRLYPAVLSSLAPVLGEWTVGSSKTVREAAIEVISKLDEPLRGQTLADALDRGTAANLETLINHLARQGEPGQALLQSALDKACGGKKDEVLSAALKRSRAASTLPEVGFDIPPKPLLENTPLGDDFVTAFQSAFDRWVEKMQKSLESDPKQKWIKQNLDWARSQGSGFFRLVLDYLNGKGDAPKDIHHIPNTIWQCFKLTLSACVRISTNMNRSGKESHKPVLNFWRLTSMAGTDYDLRVLAEAAALAGVDEPIEQVGDEMFGWSGLNGRRDGDVWPFFAEHPLRLEQALGLAERVQNQYRYAGDEIGIALKILRMFPAVPAKYIPALAQYATGTGKTHRRQAQQLLERQPDVLSIAAQTLSDGKSDVRAAGAAWIGRIGDPAGVELLRAALSKEKREQPQAAMLNALHRLGDDISAHLTPAVLAAAAKKGLTAKMPAGLEWFPMDALPACRWADGSAVDPDTVRWWTVLADKLKDPLGVGLIPLYVSLLDGSSRQALGSFVLDAWIARDVANPSDEDCRDYAARKVDSRYNNYQEWAKRSPQYYGALGAMTKDQVFEELRRERAKEYLGSAIANKGLLALTVGAPGHHIFAAAQRYIRDHGQRRSQIEVLVTAASGSDDSAAIQLVLSVARKFKQETVRQKAAELAEAIAERSGWSLDELSDRTIPTAGFDEDGLLKLDYGSRCFTGRITRSPKTGAFTIAVFNPDGKPVSALPKPTASDDEAKASESRKQLTTSKKEITQVVNLQTSRLFEAMCIGRTWDVAGWREFLLGHPVMKHLVSTLVWRIKSGGDGQSYRLFRPAIEGELLNADDETVDLGEMADAKVGLAHLATIVPREAEQWLNNLRDYNVKPLFSQFEAAAPQTTADATGIEDHLGWLSDSFAIRGRANKRGYARGQAEDGGWFSEYFKTLPQAGIKVVIEFTGSVVPEEQIPASIKELYFEREGRRLRLGDVPPILLAESYADYVNIAEAGVFDPQWESKSGY